MKAVFSCQFDDALENLFRIERAGRVVGIGQNQRLGLLGDLCFQLLDVHVEGSGIHITEHGDVGVASEVRMQCIPLKPQSDDS